MKRLKTKMTRRRQLKGTKLKILMTRRRPLMGANKVWTPVQPFQH
jgi:hypothetical protein